MSFAVSNDLGSAKIDLAFFAALKSIFGERFIADYERKYEFDWVEIKSGFEAVKEQWNGDDDDSGTVPLPESFRRLIPEGKNIAGLLSAYCSAERLGPRELTYLEARGVLKLSGKFIKKMFDPVVTGVVDLLRSKIAEARGCNSIFVVGDLCESRYLR